MLSFNVAGQRHSIAKIQPQHGLPTNIAGQSTRCAFFDLIGRCQAETDQCSNVLFIVVPKAGDLTHGKINRREHMKANLVHTKARAVRVWNT